MDNLARTESSVPPEIASWLAVTIAHVQHRDWRHIVNSLGKEEIPYWIEHIESMTEPFRHFRSCMGLPDSERQDFWFTDVLPVLKRRLAPQTKGRKRHFEGQDLFKVVKASVDIEQVASGYTSLRRSGYGRLLGLCPVHDERTPSFHVFPDEQRWYCFGACNRGGDVIELVRLLMEVGKW